MGEGLRQVNSLHYRAHLDLGSSPPPLWVSPKNQEIWIVHMDKTIYVYSGSDQPHGSLLGDIDSSRTMFIHLTMDINGRITPHSPICIVHGPHKMYVNIAFRYLYG